MTSAEASLILYQALAEPIGLLLATSEPGKARQRLYAERAKIRDPELDSLQFRASPFEGGDLVICKVRVQIERRQSESED